MAGRHCSICSHPTKLVRAAQLIAAGVSDVSVAAELQVGRMAVQRHRVGHVLAPAQAIAAAAAKSRVVEAQRTEVVARAEAGTLDPADYLGLAPIVDGLRRTDERLERVAASAEQAGQTIGVSAVSGQQIRLAETKAKLGGVGGYGTVKGPGGCLGNGDNRFSVQIVFASSGVVETFTTRETHEIIDGQADESASDE
jgi:hypothetical protein